MAGMSWTSKVCDPGELGQNQSRVLPNQGRDAGTNERIVEFRLHPHPLKYPRGKASRWLVDAIGDEDMSAGFPEGQQRRGDCTEPRWREESPVAAFKLGQRCLKRPRGGIGRTPIGVLDIARLKALRIGEEDCGASKNGRIDEARKRTRITPKLRQRGFQFEAATFVFTSHAHLPSGTRFKRQTWVYTANARARIQLSLDVGTRRAAANQSGLEPSQSTPATVASLPPHGLRLML